jgi:MraZ protein
MFLGEYTHTIDDKGRLTIPSKYRPLLQAGLVVTRGPDRCIAVYPMDAWKELVEKITALPKTPKPMRQYTRLIFSAASDLLMDRQGRILIPSVLSRYAEIDSEVIITGMNDRFEIWNPTRWEENRTVLEKDEGAITDDLAEYGIAL